MMENSFALLKTELLYLQDVDSLNHFKAELIDYLDYYNNCSDQAKSRETLNKAIHTVSDGSSCIF